MKLEEIIEDCGFGDIQVSAVHGGDINACYCLQQKARKCFLKINDAANHPHMFQKEANGLLALKQHTAFTIPSVVKHGVVNSKQYLLMEWIESGTPQPAFWKQFAHALAAMHRQTQSFFGWTENNYIGSLPQINSRYTDWALFYSECRILPLVKILFNNGVFTKHDLINARLVCQKFNTLFPNEPPAFLHGDLWSGNFMVAANGNPVLIDPAVYYGHREMDIGMMKLFGGFQLSLFDTYHEFFPLEKGWEGRLPLAQLYPLLVHAVLFGGSYVMRVKEIFQTFA